MKIGSISFSAQPVLALAPMAGYTDVAFRELMARRGADLVFSELASATAIARNSPSKTDLEDVSCATPVSSSMLKTSRIIQVGPSGVTGIQLFGASPEDLGSTVKLLGEQISSGQCQAKLIDLNFGCPAPKVTKTGAGSALLDDPSRMADFARAAVKFSPVPVTAKIRLGYKDKNNVAIARALAGEGISALTVHGRTAAQKFSGAADWFAIGEVVRAVSIPVFGNGDVSAPEDVGRIIAASGCPAVSVGRGALSNPLFFAQARALAEGKTYAPTAWADRAAFLGEYIALLPTYGLPEHSAKDLALQMCEGFEGAARVRGQITLCKTVEDLQALLLRVNA
ncbi:MAG: tRNA-dihydrouridine synthase family protein [Candidatus Micrarchaeota archaeon]|nr:tRNA-dihydrouridine synthase family protein [Candidatus Micrarchaeota archaeon]